MLSLLTIWRANCHPNWKGHDSFTLHKSNTRRVTVGGCWMSIIIVTFMQKWVISTSKITVLNCTILELAKFPLAICMCQNRLWLETNWITNTPTNTMVEPDAISCPIKKMCVFKNKVKCNNAKPVINVVRIFLRLLIIGQQRQVEIELLLAYKLCAILSSQMDEHIVVCAKHTNWV